MPGFHSLFSTDEAVGKRPSAALPHPSLLRRTSTYASFLGISEALHLEVFHQPLKNRFFDSLDAT
jgi:hypothetical protein